MHSTTDKRTTDKLRSLVTHIDSLTDNSAAEEYLDTGDTLDLLAHIRDTLQGITDPDQQEGGT